MLVNVQVPSSSTDTAQQAVHHYTTAVQQEYGSLEKGLHIALSAAPAALHVLTKQAAQQLLTLLLLLPHGVVKHSHTVAGTHLCEKRRFKRGCRDSHLPDLLWSMPPVLTRNQPMLPALCSRLVISWHKLVEGLPLGNPST